jgi:DNA invertase Pin-like site-specific DNA recombinase
MKVCAYLRVSTASQTTDNQRRELEAVALHRGWQIIEWYEDAGISGSKGRDKRPGLDRMLKDATRGRFAVVMAWSVDRLGRSLPHLVSTLQDIEGAGCALYLHQQALDTTTPSGRALFGMLGVFAEFERAMIRERVKAGLARTKAKGTRLGRKPVNRAAVDSVRTALAAGNGTCATARIAGVSTSVVARIRRESIPL